MTKQRLIWGQRELKTVPTIRFIQPKYYWDNSFIVADRVVT